MTCKIVTAQRHAASCSMRCTPVMTSIVYVGTSAADIYKMVLSMHLALLCWCHQYSRIAAQATVFQNVSGHELQQLA